VLRWSERVRQRVEQESTGRRRQHARPAPPLEPRPPDLPPRHPEEDPVRWPATPAAASAPEALEEARAAPERWPELPADQAAGESEEELFRRLERRHRVALEQRGE